MKKMKRITNFFDPNTPYFLAGLTASMGAMSFQEKIALLGLVIGAALTIINMYLNQRHKRKVLKILISQGLTKKEAEKKFNVIKE